MDPQSQHPWGERLAAEGAAAGSDQSVRRLLRDAARVVRGRLGEVTRAGIRPLLDEAAAQVRPATLEELRSRYPGLSDDEVARRLIDRAARTAAALVMLVGGALAAQEAAAAAASAVAPPATGTTIGVIGVTALAEVLALFLLEAKLRADLGALAGQGALTPRELVAGVLGEVQAAGGWSGVRTRSLRRVLPDAAARRLAARIAALVPGRFARVVIPEVIAPLIGSVVAARIAARQARALGEQQWGRLRLLPRTTVQWGEASTGNGGRPPGAWDPSGWDRPPNHGGPRSLPPPPDR